MNKARTAPELSHRSFRFVAILAVLLAPMAGCGGSGGAASSKLGLVSRENANALSPQFRTIVYSSTDKNSADIYLTDLPADAFAEGASPVGVPGPTGVIAHIHVFLIPKAGKTPISYDATNSTLSWLVLTGDSFGVYSGGGFLLTSSRPGRSTFGGPIQDATLQLINASPGFVDQLGHCVFTGSISARHDEDLAARIRDTMGRIVATGTSR
jgi:hypothetical protein